MSRLSRRRFVGAATASWWAASRPRVACAARFPVRFRNEPRYAAVMRFADPGADEFPDEKIALEIEARLRVAAAEGNLPLAPGCRGTSPAPRAYRDMAPGVRAAVFEQGRDIAAGWRDWRSSLGTIRSARFYRLPGSLVRFDVRSARDGRLEHRVGTWKLLWERGAITLFEPIEEILTWASEPWFRDVTGFVFQGEPTFREQLARGVPYWRSCLDPACGIDLYGENGIAAGDVDGDGEDEIYVCQPGGLPNRLYKRDKQGQFRDISRTAGVDILDDTASALFVDLRNSGAQDLVVVRSGGPLLFLNDGAGRFRFAPDVFRFATEPQGSFTSVAAADYDRDGRVDLYFCCYLFYQTEAQYRYPVPYHDARNGPPNFLFRNRLNESPAYFEDVTAASGMNHHNTHYSFAATWCDYNGDGWPDLYVTNDFGRNNLYRNTGGRFADVAEEAGVVDLGPGMSAAWLDYDGDGRPDLLVSNMWSACGQRVVNDPAFGVVRQDPSLLGAYQRHVKGDSLYHNNGDGTFIYTGDREGIEIVPWSWSCEGCDFDNDGTPEIYIACGMLTNNSHADLMSFFYRHVVGKSPPRFAAAAEYEDGWDAINQLVRQEYSWAGSETNVLFARRAGRYYDFSGVSGADHAEDSRAFAITDIDGDGNLDLILKSRLGPQVRVLQNICGAGRGVIVISLRGTKSNRDAIGARVEVDGQVKWVAAGSAYVSQHTKRLHFGLGDRGRAESVRVHWPSGETQELLALPAGFLYEITEGSGDVRSHPLRPRPDWPANVLVAVENEARLRTTWLWEPVPLPEKRGGPAILVLHAGEFLPRLPGNAEAVDMRQAPADLTAAYAVLRRYLFDYRTDLETPLWMLIDREGRVRKVYADAPDEATAASDLRLAGGPVPERRALPFDGFYTTNPRRDYYKFGGALLQAGYPGRALPYLEEALRRAPGNAINHLTLGQVLLQLGRAEEARPHFEFTVKNRPQSPEAWNNLGGVAMAGGDARAALGYFLKALEIRPDSPYALVNAGQAYARLGDAAAAEKMLRRALELDPQDADAANELGLLLAKSGRLEEAKRLFQRAIEIDRAHTGAINNLGVLYVNLKQPEEAIAAFEYGIQAAPESEMMYMNLARVHLAMGNPGKARDVLERLRDRVPDSNVARRALEELGNR